MKLNCWILTAAAAVMAIVGSAQTTNVAGPAPGLSPMTPASSATAEMGQAPETKPAKAKPKAKKAHAKKKNEVMRFDPPVMAVVKDEVVNVRGQPSFAGEVIGHLKKGEMVTVYESVTIGSREKNEPAKWMRVDMPTNHLAWVDAKYIDATNETVKARKLNVRGGPGENYSVVGHLEKGAAIVEVRREKAWIGIHPPTNAYAYVASECLNIQPAAPMAATTPAPVMAPPTVVETPVEQPTPVAAQPEPTSPPPVAPAPTAASQSEQELTALRKAMEPPAPTAAPAATPAPSTTILPAEVPPRIVTREGFVHRAYNIQAPADYELHDIKTGEIIDYLQPQASQSFKMYVGTRINVTGPEVMDSRWPRTPILQVQTVDLMP